MVTCVKTVAEILAPAASSRLSSVPLAWRLWHCREAWLADVECPAYIKEVIEHGYRLPFESYPPQTFRENSTRCAKFSEFVDKKVSEYLKEGCIVEVEERPWMVCALGVDDSRDKLRLTYNYRPGNKHLKKEKFKYESINTARDLAVRAGWLFQFDIESAYPHVRVDRRSWGCLGFSWGGKWFVFCTLPFGLSTAPFIFSKLLRVVVKSWRSRGLRVMTMLDDGLGLAASRREAIRHAIEVRASLETAGFKVHASKSKWLPQQSTEAFLGYKLDLNSNEIGLKKERVEKIYRSLVSFSRGVNPSRREIASLAGRIISSSAVLGDLARLMSRSLYELISDYDRSWEAKVEWTAGAWAEVRFWRQFAIKGGFERGTQFWPVSPQCTELVCSDASDVALGVVCHKPDGSFVGTARNLTVEESPRSSTWRELAAIVHGLESFGPPLKGCVVRWNTDNQAAAIILSRGSKKPSLQQLAVKCFTLATSFKLVLLPQWIPRRLNELADEWSRKVDYDNWGPNARSLR